MIKYFEHKLSANSEIAVIGKRDPDFDFKNYLLNDYQVNLFFEMHQFHSDLCLDLRDTKLYEEYKLINQIGLPYPEKYRSDAIIINEDLHSKNIFAVKTADCLPIVIANSRNIALVHAGWRGLANQITSKTLKQMKLDFDLPIHIYVGPHASCNKYEIQTDILTDFPLANVQSSAQGIYLDMLGTLKAELEQLKLNCNLTFSDRCTISNTEFYSHRRSNSEKQRNYTLVIIK
jgi:YfiH family protein